jgi:hypothetical protein
MYIRTARVAGRWSRHRPDRRGHAIDLHHGCADVGRRIDEPVEGQLGLGEIDPVFRRREHVAHNRQQVVRRREFLCLKSRQNGGNRDQTRNAHACPPQSGSPKGSIYQR